MIHGRSGPYKILTDINGNLVVINASGEVTVHDADLLAKATDIETNQTDKSQYTRITNGTYDADVNSDGQLHVVLKGKVDVNNSTTTPLAANATYTGTSIDTLEYAVITLFVYADVVSETDGLDIQFSPDDTTWYSSDTFTIPGARAKTFSFQPQAQYFRVVYTNAAATQSTFKLQTILKKSYVKPSSHRIGDEISGQDDAELVKTAITGEDELGEWHNTDVTQDGDLKISDNSSGLAIAKGDVSNTTFINKFGNAPDFDTGDGDVTVWDGAEDGTAWENMVYDYSGLADIDSISSNNAGDTQIIEIQGLDANGDIIVQDATLNGQTRVALTTPLRRVFRMKNEGFTAIAGYIFCYVNGAITAGVPDDASTIRAILKPGNDQTEMAVYTIPTGKRGYIRSFFIAQAGASKATNYLFKLKARGYAQVFQLKHRASISSTGGPYQHIYIEPDGPFYESSDIEMTVQVTAGGVSAAAASAGFDIVLVDETNSWDIPSFTYKHVSISTDAPSAAPRGVFFCPSGANFYVVDATDNRVYQFKMTEVWNVLTGTYTVGDSVDISGETNSGRDLFLKSDGTALYVMDNTNDAIRQYTIGTAWELSTASYASKSLDVSSQCSEPDGLFIDNTGTRVFVLCNSGDTVYPYTLGTAWDISTGTYDGAGYALPTGDWHQVWFKDDGTKMYVLEADDEAIYVYSLAIAWDITTATSDGTSLDLNSETSDPRGMFIREDGRFLSVIDTGNDQVYQYRLN